MHVVPVGISPIDSLCRRGAPGKGNYVHEWRARPREGDAFSAMLDLPPRRVRNRLQTPTHVTKVARGGKRGALNCVTSAHSGAPSGRYITSTALSGQFAGSLIHHGGGQRQIPR